MGQHAALVLLALLVPFGAADLKGDLYNAAKHSSYLKNVDSGTIDNFLLDRPDSAPNLLVMFHTSSCHICKGALPEFELVARDLTAKKLPITFAHGEYSSDSALQERIAGLGFTGTPAMIFWRPWANASKAVSKADRAELEDLVGGRVVVSDDKELMLRTSRAARMASDNDAKRLRALGADGEVVQLDLLDGTAQVRIISAEGQGSKVWLPLEVLRRGDGLALPRSLRRVPPGVEYRGFWKRDLLTGFAERMMRPPVVQLNTSSMLTKAMQGEKLAGLVLCSGRVPEGFTAAAASLQGRLRSFQAADGATCPVAPPPPGVAARLVVYSAAAQQWAPQGQKARPALVVRDVASDAGEEELVEWSQKHLFPGITKLTYQNFPEFVNTGRGIAMVAITVGRKSEEHLTKRQLKEVAPPASDAGAADLYEYPGDTYFWAVVDGTLNGLDRFGIDKARLPRVVLMEEHDVWIEDYEELTLERLSEDLKKLPKLPRQRGGLQGFLTRRQRDAKRLLQQADHMATALFGQAGHVGLVLIGPLVLVLLLRMLVRAFLSLIRALFFDSGDSGAAAAPPAKAGGRDSKKRA